MTDTNTSIHGHEILHYIQAKGPVPKSDLEAWASAQFGTDSRYHACFASGMDFHELIEALGKRGKIKEIAQGYVMGDGADICEDE